MGSLGLSPKELGEALGVTPGAAKVVVHRATQICAVVATYDHRVDNPQNVSCGDLPH